MPRRKSKYLSRVLRHEPELVGLTLGPGGWVVIEDLLRGLAKAGQPMRLDELHQAVAEDAKQRYTLSEDGLRIRAAQGHSTAVDLKLDAITPPAALFHGTARTNLDAIFAEGLRPGRRQYVHLSPDAETASQVGQRHGRPVVLRIQTGRMHEDGHAFYRADNGVWLTASVAPQYLGF